MGLINRARKLKKLLTGARLFRAPPRGMDVIKDIANALPNHRIGTVFDVGANLGQSAKIYLARFPGSHVYCFEPVSNTFHQLQRNLKGNQRVDCYHLALGSSKRRGTMVLEGDPDRFFLTDQSAETPGDRSVATESVDVVTLDEFCQTKGIDQINYLKIDTEGGDLEVLKGALNMLTGQKVDLLELEAGMNPGNKKHVRFETLKEFLESHGYFLFGIYEQVDEWPTKEPQLRRTNPVFISSRLIELNRKPG